LYTLWGYGIKFRGTDAMAFRTAEQGQALFKSRMPECSFIVL